MSNANIVSFISLKRNWWSLVLYLSAICVPWVLCQSTVTSHCLSTVAVWLKFCARNAWASSCCCLVQRRRGVECPSLFCRLSVCGLWRMGRGTWNSWTSLDSESATVTHSYDSCKLSDFFCERRKKFLISFCVFFIAIFVRIGIILFNLLTRLFLRS